MSDIETTLSPNSTPADIRAWLVARLAEHLRIPAAGIDEKTAFVELGLDSITGLTLTGDLADSLDRELSQTLFWDYPTIAVLSEFLGSAHAAPVASAPATTDWPAVARRCGVSEESYELMMGRTDQWSAVTRPQAGMLTTTIAGDATRLPVFWCGGYDRTAVLQRLTGRTFHMHPTGQGLVDHTEANVRALAAYWFEEIRAIAPKGPYLIGGYCYGGKTTFETARLLRDAGETVALMVQLEWAGPSPAYWRWYRLKYPFLSTDARRDFRQYGQRVKEQGFAMATGRLAKRMAERMQKGDKMRAGRELVERRRRLRQLPVDATEGATWHFMPAPLDVPTLVVVARESGFHTKAFGKVGWDGVLTGPLDVAVVPGDHFSMIDGAGAAELGRTLEGAFAGAESRTR